MQLFYGKPSDDNIEAYIEELVILLVNKCLKMVEYGFKRGDSWVVVARYTVQSDGTSVTDDRSGRVPAGANTSSALWHSFLEYNGTWFSLSENKRQRIRNSLPFQRTDGNDLFDAVEEYPSYMPTQLDEIKSLRAYIQSSGVGARLCPAPHAGRLALGQNLGSLLHCHGAGQQRLVVQVLRPMHQAPGLAPTSCAVGADHSNSLAGAPLATDASYLSPDSIHAPNSPGTATTPSSCLLASWRGRRASAWLLWQIQFCARLCSIRLTLPVPRSRRYGPRNQGRSASRPGTHLC